MFGRLLHLVGDHPEKELRRLRPLVARINDLEPETAALTPNTIPSSAMRSRMRVFSSTSIRGLSFTRLIRVRATSAPV